MNYKLKVISTEHCSQCKLQHKEFNKNIPSVPIEYIDGDELSDEEIETLKIKSIPVTILYKENKDTWKEIARWVSYVKTEAIEKYLNIYNAECHQL